LQIEANGLGRAGGDGTIIPLFSRFVKPFFEGGEKKGKEGKRRKKKRGGVDKGRGL
jgi:hypothetical protein